MSTQQTILRVQTNVQSGLTIDGTYDVTWVLSGTYIGSGTTNNPYSGYTSSVGLDIRLNNNGSPGMFYYKLRLADYTGDTVNFYDNYFVRCTNNNTGDEVFSEYAISDLDGSLHLETNQGIILLTFTQLITGLSTYEVYFVPDKVPVDPIQQYEILDTYSDVPIKINKSFAELEDISKRNSDYSIGITIPGSKKNNRFFESYFNVDSTTLFFDVTKRVPCNVLIDDESYFDGYLRLNKVSVLNSKVEYDVTLYTIVGDLFGKIGNNQLLDLNFDDIDYHFNHFFTLYNVTASWTYQPLLTQNTLPPLYIYPPVHNGYNYSGGTVLYSASTVSGITEMTRIYTSTKVGTFTDYAAFEASGGTEYNINSPKEPLLDNQLKPMLNVWGLIQLMFKTYGYTIKSDFFNTPWFKLLYTYGFYSSDLTKFGYQVQTIQTFALEGVEIVFTSAGGSDYAVVCKLGTGVPSFCNSNINVVFQYDEGEPFGIVDYPLTIIAGTSGVTSNYGGTFIGGYSPQVPNGTSLAYFPVAAGTFVNFVEYDYVNFSLVFDPLHKQIDFLSSIAKKFNLIFTPNPHNSSEIIIEPYDYFIGTGDIWDWSDKISFDKGFTVQPALNFVQSEIILTDLLDGDDGNKQFKDKNNRIYGQLNQTNNTDFKSQEKKIETIFSPELIREWDENIGLPLGINYAASSKLNDQTNTVDYTYTGVKTKMKLLYWVGNFSPFLDQVGESYNFSGTSVNTVFFRLQQSDGTNPLNNTYANSFVANPVISHTIPMGNPDSNKSGRGFDNDSICILFNSELPVAIANNTTSYSTYTENDTYNMFYSNRIDNLYNKSTRLLTGNFYLKLSDIKNLKPQDLIKINDQYFTWNKISEYNLTNVELTNVELIQTNLNPSTYPTRYFKYKYCNGDGTEFKFRTYFNPEENPNYIGSTEERTNIRLTYFFWSVLYDYMVGVLGGNVTGYTSSYLDAQSDLYRYAYSIYEVNQTDYNSSGLDAEYDSNNSIFINNSISFPTLDTSEENPWIWVFSNQTGHTNERAFLNVAVDCTTFTGLCSTNYVTLQPAPIYYAPPTPTPTPTPSPTPLPNQMRGSLIFTFDQTPNYKGIDNYTITVNGQPRVLNYNNNDNLYTTYIYSGDSVTITISPELNDFSVYRRDYTTDDQGGDMGIRDVFITGNTGTYSITFTVTTSSIDYNFEYRVGATTYTGVTYNILTEDTKDILAEDNDELITEQNII